MKTIVQLTGAVLVLMAIGAGFAGLLFPIMFELKFREIYGKHGLTYSLTALQLIGLISTLNANRSSKTGALTEELVITIIFFIVAMVVTYKRMKKMGLNRRICLMAVLAQFLAPVGILLIIALIGSLFNEDKDKKGKSS